MKNPIDRSNRTTPLLAPLWADTAPASPQYPTLTETVDADVVIIGGGFTGLSTALALAERGRTAIVLEAGQPGSGASGVSGGQVIPGLRHFDHDLMSAYGPEIGRRAYKFGGDSADRTFAIIARHNIECGAAQTGKIQAADSAAGVGCSSPLAQRMAQCVGWLSQAWHFASGSGLSPSAAGGAPGDSP